MAKSESRFSSFFTVRLFQLVCFVTFSLVSVLISYFFNYTQPNPFIDELFHIPQAAKFCKGNFFEWDQKITTLPGLYLFSIGIFKPIGLLLKYDICTVNILRSTNLICAIFNFYLIYEILKVKNISKEGIDQKSLFKILLSALNISTFPVLYFFSFLYYTDVLSTSMILLMYALHLQSKHQLSAAMGFFSVVVRQTNIIWVFYIGAELVLTDLEVFFEKISKKSSIHKGSYLKVSQAMFKQLISRGTHKKVLGFAVVLFLFVLFVMLNQGIVVGDRSSHTPVLNVPQMFYFATFCLFFSLPYALRSLQQFGKLVFSIDRAFIVFLWLVSFYYVVQQNTLVHQYTLADNRHYAFYIWKRLYENIPYFRYFMVPVYVFAFFHIMKNCTFKFFLLYLICVVLCLVPQKLLEFRYFILPYILYRLHFNVNSLRWWELALEFVINSLVNIATIYIFFTKKFYWEDSADIQRIMW
uniref:Dol-P-Glc:Glc(2)Man(9)GlcNAc(2)-PP-Dol alpha-1,2-glucosyltransferase n=1 Tax=Cacopsylla melanoneura TaxID=428564 RepID=A0A8D8PXV8_9HEMI